VGKFSNFNLLCGHCMLLHFPSALTSLCGWKLQRFGLLKLCSTNQNICSWQMNVKLTHFCASRCEDNICKKEMAWMKEQWVLEFVFAFFLKQLDIQQKSGKTNKPGVGSWWGRSQEKAPMPYLIFDPNHQGAVPRLPGNEDIGCLLSRLHACSRHISTDSAGHHKVDLYTNNFFNSYFTK